MTNKCVLPIGNLPYRLVLERELPVDIEPVAGDMFRRKAIVTGTNISGTGDNDRAALKSLQHTLAYFYEIFSTRKEMYPDINWGYFEKNVFPFIRNKSR